MQASATDDEAGPGSRAGRAEARATKTGVVSQHVSSSASAVDRRNLAAPAGRMLMLEQALLVSVLSFVRSIT
jgi:hypothetical protein